jgi:hypothetical protein
MNVAGKEVAVDVAIITIDDEGDLKIYIRQQGYVSLAVEYMIGTLSLRHPKYLDLFIACITDASFDVDRAMTTEGGGFDEIRHTLDHGEVHALKRDAVKWRKLNNSWEAYTKGHTMATRTIIPYSGTQRRFHKKIEQ